MNLRRRHRSAEEEPANHSEVWPAYVDVLSAAFVFILLAFLALMTRDAKSAEERARSDETQRKAVEDWVKKATATVQAASDTYRGHITNDVLTALPATVRDRFVGQCSLPPGATLTVDEAKLDGERRHEVTLICTLSADLVSFDTGRWEPAYHPPELQGGLVKVAKDLSDHECLDGLGGALTTVAWVPRLLPPWCATGFEVVGHADCRPVVASQSGGARNSGGRPLTNWELSTNRAGAVIRDMLALSSDSEVALRASFDVFAGGREARVSVKDTVCNENNACDDKCLEKNRRVVIRIKLRTPPLDPKPTPSTMKGNP